MVVETMYIQEKIIHVYPLCVCVCVYVWGREMMELFIDNVYNYVQYNTEIRSLFIKFLSNNCCSQGHRSCAKLPLN